jgi:hypothetical protein
MKETSVPDDDQAWINAAKELGDGKGDRQKDLQRDMLSTLFSQLDDSMLITAQTMVTYEMMMRWGLESVADRLQGYAAGIKVVDERSDGAFTDLIQKFQEKRVFNELGDLEEPDGEDT